jgi:hypothetical protein
MRFAEASHRLRVVVEAPHLDWDRSAEWKSMVQYESDDGGDHQRAEGECKSNPHGHRPATLGIVAAQHLHRLFVLCTLCADQDEQRNSLSSHCRVECVSAARRAHGTVRDFMGAKRCAAEVRTVRRLVMRKLIAMLTALVAAMVPA